MEWSNKMSDDTKHALLEGYTAMAADEQREREAAEWVEGLVLDIDQDEIGGLK